MRKSPSKKDLATFTENLILKNLLLLFLSRKAERPFSSNIDEFIDNMISFYNKTERPLSEEEIRRFRNAHQNSKAFD